MQYSIKPDDYAGTMLTLKRFAARAALLFIWCALGTAPLSKISVLAGTFCIVLALFSLLKGEKLAGPALNHWDEAVAFLMISHGARIIEKVTL